MWRVEGKALNRWQNIKIFLYKDNNIKRQSRQGPGKPVHVRKRVTNSGECSEGRERMPVDLIVGNDH